MISFRQADLLPAFERSQMPTIYCQIELTSSKESLMCHGISYTSNVTEEMQEYGIDSIFSFVEQIGFKRDEHGYWRFHKNTKNPHEDLKNLDDLAKKSHEWDDIGDYSVYIDFDMKTQTLSLAFKPKDRDEP